MISESLDKDFSLHVHIVAERGSNENFKGLIRQYIPKKNDFLTISYTYVKHVENLNNRPGKI